jgi:hypothetical protein
MHRNFLAACALTLLVVSLYSPSTLKCAADTRLKHAFRRPMKSGWIFVHLQGSPSEIGYQHGYLLAPEIADALKVTIFEKTTDTKKSWQFLRDAARATMWPHIEREYQEELLAIADGAKAGGVKMDVWDIVAMNAFPEWSYYVTEYDKQRRTQSPRPINSPDHCSAFVATGSYTRDGKVVIAQNDWTNYMDGERWTIVFDIVPDRGNRILMDGLPGLIHSGDDFGLNSAGIVITETTISGFSGYDFAGIPEFVRARKAMQYSVSIDEFVQIMKEGNNGGYADDWLVADAQRNEIARLELGLKNVTLERTKDGYFVGSNFPVNEKLTHEETDFDPHDMSSSPSARRVRWEQLMAEYKGRIDVAAARRFLADHYDSFDKKIEPGERTLCGHVDLSPRGMSSWWPPFAPAGAVQNKVTDAAMTAKMQFTVAAGHACGTPFRASEHLQAHPEFSDQKDLLRDMNAEPWTIFTAAK